MVQVIRAEHPGDSHAQINPANVTFLNDPPVEDTLYDLYDATLKQGKRMFMHFLPKIHQILGRGIDWETENEDFLYR